MRPLLSHLGPNGGFRDRLKAAHGGRTNTTHDRPRILLITSRFPYGKGEQFLEAELPHWVGKDAHLIVAPEKNDTPDVLPRPRLSGIERDDRLRRRWVNPLWRGLATIEAAADPLVWHEIVQLRRLGRLRPAQIKFVLRTGIQVALVRRFLRDFYRDADLVYTYWLGPSATAAALEHRAGTIRHAVSRCHSADIYENHHPIGHHPFIRQVANGFDEILPISRDGKRFLSDRYDIDPQIVDTRCLGVSIPAKRQGCSPTGAQTLTVMSVSTMIPVKRVDLLIDALATFHRDHPELELTWIHAGDGILREELTRQAHERLSGVTVQLLGILPNVELLDFYLSHQIDLLVSTSSSEGIPVSMMEAMAREVPVLGTDVGGVSEVVLPGWLMDSSSTAQQIADAIWEHAEQAKDPQLRAEMARKVRTDFDGDVNFERFINELVDLAHES